MASYRRVLGATLALSTLGACGSSETPASSTASAEEDGVYEIEWDYGPGTFQLPDTAAGLSDLSSYTATLTLEFDGTNGGQPEQWSSTYVMVATGEPEARQLTIASTGAAAAPDPVYMAEVGGVAFERSGAGECTATELRENGLAALWEPAALLGGSVTGAVDAGDDPVSGVAAHHYTFDERAFGPLAPSESTGELWVAADGGYLVRYVVTTKAAQEYFGEGVEGTVTWNYELTDVNEPLTVVVPDDCPAGPA